MQYLQEKSPVTIFIRLDLFIPWILRSNLMIDDTLPRRLYFFKRVSLSCSFD
jgi:hypothetical protein